jgi:hypothetical protein
MGARDGAFFQGDGEEFKRCPEFTGYAKYLQRADEVEFLYAIEQEYADVTHLSPLI